MTIQLFRVELKVSIHLKIRIKNYNTHINKKKLMMFSTLNLFLNLICNVTPPDIYI